MRGLCLCGGGIKAAAHIGALKAFEEEKIKFDCVSGASSGSIIAIMYALGFKSNEMWKMFKEFSPKIKYYQWKQIFKLILGLIFKREIIIDGLNSGDILEKIVMDICIKNQITQIDEIKMPLLIPIVDMHSGTVYVASSKEVRSVLLDNTKYITDIPIGKAVRASCSYPVVFCPCEYQKKQFIDGGIRDNLPWRHLKQVGANEVWGISFNTISNKKECCSNIIETAVRALELQGRELSIYEKEGIDKLITINMKKVSLLDAKKAEYLYNIGYIQTKKQIEKYALH